MKSRHNPCLRINGKDVLCRSILTKFRLRIIMNIITKAAFLLAIMLSSSVVSASIIDNGDYTTVNGTDWLDWSLTEGMSQAHALAQFTDYRTATLTEMVDMMNTMYVKTFDFDQDGHEHYVYEPMDDDYAMRFQALFTNAHSGGLDVRLAKTDELGLVGYAGSSWYAGYKGGTSSLYGIALVRNEVPEPSTFAILFLGIIALVSRQFKKH